jgi:Flp pilus assembly pilin Flp
MKKRSLRSRGQGLVEYALILMLVAVVAIVIMARFGHSIQGIFGMTTAALGQKVSIGTLKIEYAECFVKTASHKTGIWVRGATGGIPLDTIEGRTDRNYGGTIDENHVHSPNATTDAGSFSYTTVLANTADSGLCPRVAVIQADNGALAAWPLIVNVTND